MKTGFIVDVLALENNESVLQGNNNTETMACWSRGMILA